MAPLHLFRSLRTIGRYMATIGVQLRPHSVTSADGLHRRHNRWLGRNVHMCQDEGHLSTRGSGRGLL